MNNTHIATETTLHVIANIFPVSVNLNSAPPPLLLTGAVFESVFDPGEEEDVDPAGELETELVHGDSVLVLESGSAASLKIFASGEFGGRFNIAAIKQHILIINTYNTHTHVYTGWSLKTCNDVHEQSETFASMLQAEGIWMAKVVLTGRP